MSSALLRDAGLRRLRIANRVLAAVAIGLTGLFADLAARAFPGHAKRGGAAAASRHDPSSSAPSRDRTHSRPEHRGVSHRITHRLAPPATTPTAATPPPTPALTPSVAPAPVPAAPAPVVSGGS